MKKLKKAFKLFVFVCLIILAGLGVGLSGGVPVPFQKNRREHEKEMIELVEENEDQQVSEIKEI